MLLLIWFALAIFFRSESPLFGCRFRMNSLPVECVSYSCVDVYLVKFKVKYVWQKVLHLVNLLLILCCRRNHMWFVDADAAIDAVLHVHFSTIHGKMVYRLPVSFLSLSIHFWLPFCQRKKTDVRAKERERETQTFTFPYGKHMSILGDNVCKLPLPLLLLLLRCSHV